MMDDRLYRDMFVAIASGLVVYFLIERHLKNSTAPVVDSVPANATYNTPQSALYNPANALQPINVNIGNQGLNYLSSDVMPMFGFVGMANGMYQQ